MLKLFKSIITIILGTAIMAFGIINFAVVNQLADGGFTGITIIFYHLFDISTGISSFLLNLPMLVISYRLFDRKTFMLTILGIVGLSSFLRLFETIGPLIPNLQDDMILAVVGYGVSLGVGLGMILRENATTGGSAIVAKIGKDIWDIPMDKTLLIFDSIVVLTSFLTFLSFSNGIYTLMGIYITSKVIAKFLEGRQAGYKVMIVSKEPEAITKMIHEKINRGVTFLHGSGSYSKHDKEIILTIIHKKQWIQLKRAIYEIDPNCFVSVSPVQETLGEGFTFHRGK